MRVLLESERGQAPFVACPPSPSSEDSDDFANAFNEISFANCPSSPSSSDEEFLFSCSDDSDSPSLSNLSDQDFSPSPVSNSSSSSVCSFCFVPGEQKICSRCARLCDDYDNLEFVIYAQDYHHDGQTATKETSWPDDEEGGGDSFPQKSVCRPRLFSQVRYPPYYPAQKRPPADGGGVCGSVCPSRCRIRTTDAQRQLLNSAFESNQPLTNELVLHLLNLLGPTWTRSRLLKWFDNRKFGGKLTVKSARDPFAKKKICTTAEERALLEVVFLTSPFPNPEEVDLLRKQLCSIRPGWNHRRVVQWFTNRRKHRKMK